MSNKMNSTKVVTLSLIHISDMVEPFGMDECWLDVTGSRAVCGDAMNIACLLYTSSFRGYNQK